MTHTHTWRTSWSFNPALLRRTIPVALKALIISSPAIFRSISMSLSSSIDSDNDEKSTVWISSIACNALEKQHLVDIIWPWNTTCSESNITPFHSESLTVVLAHRFKLLSLSHWYSWASAIKTSVYTTRWPLRHTALPDYYRQISQQETKLSLG